MAATRNFNGVSEDMDTSLLDVDINDPDLEARLYGEIYYSNETYPDPVPQGTSSPQVNNSTAPSAQWSTGPQPGQSKSPGESQGPKKRKHRALIDGLPGAPFSQFSRSRKPEGNESNLRNQKTWDSQRVSPRGESPRESSTLAQRPRKSREAIASREKMTQDTEELMEEDEEPDSTSLTALDEAMTANSTPEPSRQDSTPSRSPQDTPHEDSTPQPPPDSQDDRKTPEESSNSKYKVQSKKSRRDPSPVIVEDSDDSILEMPVPPKPLPPLISLQDSDEESDESPVKMDTTQPKEQSSESSDSSGSSSPEIIDEDTTSQLIINCTSVQKGVSSLAEIKKQRKQRERNPGGHSDEESMTESEALNWGSLEGEICKEGELVGVAESVEVWEGIVEDRDQRRNLLDESGSSGKCSEGTPLVPEQREAEDKGPGGQKRAHSGGSGRNEGIPRKKKKRERNMGLQEYLFQPMPKQLRDFYNEPRGGDIMRDVKEIQNDMPKHPSRWVILDADLYPRPHNKKNSCAFCQREGHPRSRCPERPRFPTCHICGVVGHAEPRCPESKKCFNCGKKSSTCRRTCENCNSLRCTQCKARGHYISNCPDNWRKYHQTTSGTAVNIPTDLGSVLKPSYQLSCSNCTRRGHEASTCTGYRWSGHFLQSCWVRDYNEGPIYPAEVPQVPQVHQVPQVPQMPQMPQLPMDNLEPIDASTLGMNIAGPSNILFYFLNPLCHDVSTWQECSLVSNPLSSVNYPHADPILPHFLRTQFKDVKNALMEVTIKQHHTLHRLVITLKTPYSSTLKELKELLRQWLMRPSDDQEIMNRIKPLPIRCSGLLRVLSKEMNNFMNRNISSKTWRKGSTALQESIAQETGRRSTKNPLREMQMLANSKFGCVVAAYKYMLIDTPGDVLKPFWEFLQKLDSLHGQEAPFNLYIKAVWYCFELFTPHLSPPVLRAMEAGRDDPAAQSRGRKAFKKFNLQTKNSRWFLLHRSKIVRIVDLPIPPPDFCITTEPCSKPLKKKTKRKKKDKVVEPPPLQGTGGEEQPKESSTKKKKKKRKKSSSCALAAPKGPPEGVPEGAPEAAPERAPAGVPEGVPSSKDKNIFTPAVVPETKALEVVKEKATKDESKCIKIIQGNSNVSKKELINMWNDIRNHSIKRSNKRIS